ncbi:hypothetical protein EWM62_05205 [Mucilaginibacter terrigena]|uniref:Uncharacterized protein n=1 Tax=Mucilaginibacter terrigena TaxID=2492395 RepID=A0A4V1ZC41_9SPHI|nr:hypothetical protein [Mucilaginibacter terrigena]RYU91340.1 hypothetical protein EWM62_05205 [Mucilaginibacter terrigena]
MEVESTEILSLSAALGLNGSQPVSLCISAIITSIITPIKKMKAQPFPALTPGSGVVGAFAGELSFTLFCFGCPGCGGSAVGAKTLPQ